MPNPVEIASGDNAARKLKVNADGSINTSAASGSSVGIDQTTPGTTNKVSLGVVSTVSLSALASAATSAQALAANSARAGLLAYNTDANDCYLKYGTTASATSFTVKIPANGYWEMPQPIYTGRIDAIWSVDGSGSLYLTEL